jgi:ATP-dependent RNA helicase DeaD
MLTFSSLGIRKGYIKSINELGIKIPSEIQEKAIPILLRDKTDFIGLAQTGTGKTAAFGLPILHKINVKSNKIQALILSPTRELVQQIKRQLFKFTKYSEERIFVEAVYGGEHIGLQINNLKRTTHIVVATPGRLVDLIERGDIDIRSVQTVVLDEADEMLSMGFKEELNKILSATKKGDRSTWLFSATMPDEIKRIVKVYMHPDAPRIEVNKGSSVNGNIKHQYVRTTIKDKTDHIVAFLDKRESQRGIIFCRTKAGTQSLCTQLIEKGFSTGALEGDMQQREREKVMRAFKNKSLQYLVSTDVSARGIDVKDLEFVIHHQLPEKLEYYTHRSGRTARGGRSGISIAFILPIEVEKIHYIQKKLNIKFKEVDI